jgi:hypothetical protein
LRSRRVGSSTCRRPNARSRGKNLGDILRRGRIVLHLFGDQGAKAHDRGEDVIEVVGDAAGQLPDGLHLLHQIELALETLAIGEHRRQPLLALPERFRNGVA